MLIAECKSLFILRKIISIFFRDFAVLMICLPGFFQFKELSYTDINDSATKFLTEVIRREDQRLIDLLFTIPSPAIVSTEAGNRIMTSPFEMNDFEFMRIKYLGCAPDASRIDIIRSVVAFRKSKKSPWTIELSSAPSGISVMSDN